MNAKEIVIFGSGELGELAYYYYYKTNKIRCFVDNNKDRQGKKWNEIYILSPDILREIENPIVVIAAGRVYQPEISRQLWKEYGIRQAVVFSVNAAGQLLSSNNCFETDCDMVMSYSGGLGNQMFQYAFARYLEETGFHIAADISFYGIAGYPFIFCLEEYFNIQLVPCNMDDKPRKRMIQQDFNMEWDRFECELKSLGRQDSIWLDGYWQTHIYADAIREKLIREFSFKKRKEEKLVELENKLMNGNYTSIHFRGADYINNSIYSNVCTKDYYKQAVDYIRRIDQNTEFLIFSNDIEWAKNEFNMKDAMFFERNIFSEYEDWYDMLLMSKCKNNIIANSTFSWWGAWLNINADKIVIAPKKWANGYRMHDLCPQEWIRL